MASVAVAIVAAAPAARAEPSPAKDEASAPAAANAPAASDASAAPVGSTAPAASPPTASPPPNPLAPHPRPLRAAGEIVAGLAPFAIRYWIAPGAHGKNPEWDDASFSKRLSLMIAPGFDGDAILTNGLAHPLGGAFVYEIARSNDLGPVPSFFFTVGASLLWEYAVEVRIPPSLNDLLYTPIGGLPIGESFARLGAFFDRSNCCRAGAWILWPERKINDAFDGRHRPVTPALDPLGLPADAWHRFELNGGLGPTLGNDQTNRPWGGVRVESELLDVLEAGGPGTASRGLGPGTSTELDAAISFAQEGLYGFDFFAKTLLFGHYTQAVTGGPLAPPAGHRFWLGLATAFEYWSHRFAPQPLDTLAMLNVIGPTLDVTLLGPRWTFRLAFDGYLDVAATHSQALTEYVAARGLDDADVRNYFFAFGASGRVRAWASYAGVHAGATLNVDGFESAEHSFPIGEHANGNFGQSRVDLSGTGGTSMRIAERGFLAYQAPGSWVEAPRVEIEHLTRTGRFGGFVDDRNDTRLLVGVGAQF